MPAAPHTWIARSTTRVYAAGTNTLIAEMSVLAPCIPLSVSSAARKVIKRAAWMSM